MNCVVISDDTMKKPDAQIFLQALKLLDVRPEETFFVGDNPTADIAGAHNVGMKTIFKGSQRFGSSCATADHCIVDLRELLSVSNIF